MLCNFSQGLFEVLNKFYEISQNRYFWLTGAAYLLLMEAIALFWQYALGTYPCALCVQIRAWVYGALIFAVIGSFVFRNFWWRWVGLTMTTAFLAGALYTSWYSWGVEKGTIISSCTMGAGFPEFMPLDEWIPLLFRAEGFCGQSPEMWLGLSMNETLLLTLSIPILPLVVLWLLQIPKAFAGQQ